MSHFLLKPRWLLLHVLAVATALLFSNFGFWQLRRHAEREAYNNLLEERMYDEPQSLADLLASYQSEGSPTRSGSIFYRQVSVQGYYDTEHELLYRTTQNYNGQPGYFLLTPFILPGESAVLVKRGWVPIQLNSPPVAEAKPPEGLLTLYAMVQPSEERPTGFLAALTPQDPPGELQITAWLDTERISQQMPYQLLPLILELRVQSPAQQQTLPLPNLPVELSAGPHLGYAIQWFAFVMIGVIGYGFVLRRLLVGQR